MAGSFQAPGVAEAFVDASEIKVRARASSAADFAREFPLPALLTLAVEREVAPSDFEKTPEPTELKARSARRTMVAEHGVTLATRYKGRLAFLKKRPGNLFPDMISVGRAMNNDVVIMLDTMSKFHGYFTTRGGKWFFTDQASSNGTTVNGSRLDPRVPHELADAAHVKFGDTIELLYLPPASLHEKLLQGG